MKMEGPSEKNHDWCDVAEVYLFDSIIMNGAHIYEQGKVLEKWEKVARDLNGTGMFKKEMTANKAQMKFERMLSSFKTKYTNQEYNISGSDWDASALLAFSLSSK